MGATQELSLGEFERYCVARGSSLDRIDMGPAWRDVAIALVADVRDNFDGQHDPDLVPWKSFKRKPTKRRGGASAKLLRDTGLLMASYTAGAANHVEETTATTFVWGSNLDRAGWHQRGTRTIPARPQIGFSMRLIERVSYLVLDRLDQALGVSA